MKLRKIKCRLAIRKKKNCLHIIIISPLGLIKTLNGLTQELVMTLTVGICNSFKLVMRTGTVYVPILGLYSFSSPLVSGRSKFMEKGGKQNIADRIQHAIQKAAIPYGSLQ